MHHLLPRRPVRPLRLTALVCTAVLCTALALALTVLVALRWRPLLTVDVRVSDALHAHAVAHPGWVDVVRVFSDWVWDPWTMRALAAVAVLALVLRGERELAVRFAAATVAATLVSQGLKALVGRARPVWPDPVATADYAAYPSGHALTATVVCVLLLWLAPRSWPLRVAVVVSVVGVGLTRVYLGVHWSSDVMAGWLLGGVVALVALAGARRPAPAGRAPSSPGAGQPGS
ncbi:phosphatase PAP2 family protein [Streptomyces sp. WAC06614]|uniref:phosphatase PAP2 family protein n=1 Tax=Streptomyces sp. WAC06614 TaxID=2487416 RepID=UPI000F7AB287|nr:phosphatase PAP2 family protein [Streptomyces sp. WAC06614]RSS79848.1 phosphatase PAP2 family protein [Streptomyces sp. WAC06614]